GRVARLLLVCADRCVRKLRILRLPARGVLLCRRDPGCRTSAVFLAAECVAVGSRAAGARRVVRGGIVHATFWLAEICAGGRGSDVSESDSIDDSFERGGSENGKRHIRACRSYARDTFDLSRR